MEDGLPGCVFPCQGIFTPTSSNTVYGSALNPCLSSGVESEHVSPRPWYHHLHELHSGISWEPGGILNTTRTSTLTLFANTGPICTHCRNGGKAELTYLQSPTSRYAQSNHLPDLNSLTRRLLSQALNHELGPKGVHVVHVNVDGPVDAPETLGKLMPEVILY